VGDIGPGSLNGCVLREQGGGRDIARRVTRTRRRTARLTADHLRIRDLDRRIITATQSLLDAKTSACPADRAQAEFSAGSISAQRLNGIPQVHLGTVSPEQCHWFGWYIAPGAILMPRTAS
jgi:hypothetical protein